MFTVLPRRFNLSSLVRSIPYTTAIVLGALAVPFAAAQSVPIPFAATFAGGGTVCSPSLPVFAISGTGAKYGDGCPATQATLNIPVSAITDSLGNVFIADQGNQLVRVVYNGGSALAAAIVASNVQNPGLIPVKGNIYTIAGGILSVPTRFCNQAGSGTVGTNGSLDGCPGSQSEQGPRGLAVDADGNVFIASVVPVSQIRVFYVGGTAAAKLITTENPTITSPQIGYVYNLAGGNSSSYTLDGSLATKATMNTPRGLLVDTSENIYFADQLNNVIRRVDGTTGIITTVAGHCVINTTNTALCTATTTSGDGLPATNSGVNIYAPYGMALDQYGNLFIAEAGSASLAGRIRVVYAGGTLPGIAAPTAGSIYTYAGGTAGTTQAQLATFQEVFGVTIGPAGYLYVTDYRTGSTGSNRLWRVDPANGNIVVIAGNGGSALTAGQFCNGGSTGPKALNTKGDGCPATQAYLNNPQEQLAFDSHGNFYVAEHNNNVVRSFTYNNTFAATTTQSTLTQPLAFLYAAGSLPTTATFLTEGTASTDYADGGGDTCALNTPLAAATTCVDYVKFAPAVAGQRSGTITVTSATGTIATQTLTGIGSAPVLTINPFATVPLGLAIQPLGVSTDQLGNVNISDGKGGQVLRATIAGGATTAYITGLGTPRESTTDNYGNVFVADSTNNKIVERTPLAVVASLGAGLSAPQGVVADPFGNLYVADTGNNRLMVISPVTGIQRPVPVSGITLSAPTYLAMDPAGDLFVIDTNNARLLEIPIGSSPQVVALPPGATPSAIAFDADSNLYLADTSSGSVLFVSAGTTTATAFATGLSTPSGVAVGSNGNVFVADSSATSVTGYNVSLSVDAFATTNIGLTSLPLTLTLGNVGNLAATLSTPTFTETGSAVAFAATGTPTCTAAGTLTPDGNCTQQFSFRPITPGVQSAQAVFTTTTGQSINVNFAATATNLILTNMTLTPMTSTVSYGQPVTYTATMTPSSVGSTPPSGTVSFVVDGKTVLTQSVTSTPYTLTLNSPAAIHFVAVVYSGDALFAGSNVTAVITVNKATTTTTASYGQNATGIPLTAVAAPDTVGPLALTGYITFIVDGVGSIQNPVGNGTVISTFLLVDGTHTYSASYTGDSNYAASNSTAQTLTVARTPTLLTLTITPVSTNGSGGLQLNAKLATTGSGISTGTVAFTNGATSLGTVNLSTAVNGVITFTTPSTVFTNFTFTAAYSGDGLFSSSSANASEGADFVAVAPAAGLSVAEGGQAIVAVSVAPINGYTGTLTASCSNLPANTICRFLPLPLVISSTTAATLTVQIFVGVNSNVAGLAPGSSNSEGRYALFAFLFFTPVVFSWRRRRNGVRGNRLPALFALALFAIVTAGLTGCGGKTPANVSGTFITPAGTTTIILTLTDANNVSRSAPLPLTITQ